MIGDIHEIGYGRILEEYNAWGWEKNLRLLFRLNEDFDDGVIGEGASEIEMLKDALLSAQAIEKAVIKMIAEHQIK